MFCMKVIAIVALAIPYSRAANCDTESGVCEENFDEISLVQVNKVFEYGRERSKKQLAETATATVTFPPCGDPIQCAQAEANKMVEAADKNLHEKESDWKLAEANEYVQKYAVDTAKFKMKKAERKSDFRKHQNYTAYRRSVNARHRAVDAAQKARNEALAWDAAQKAEDTYRNISKAADLVYAKRSDAVRYAEQMQAYAEKKYRESKIAMKRMETLMNANYSVSKTQSDADAAATARIQSDYMNHYANMAKLNFTDANGKRKAANANMTQAIKEARKAEREARKYAKAYREEGSVSWASQVSTAKIHQHADVAAISNVVSSSAPSANSAAKKPTSGGVATQTKTQQTVSIPMGL